MAYSLISSVRAEGTGTTTTVAIDTTGADLLIITLACYRVNFTSITDSASNTWTERTQYDRGTNQEPSISIFYCSGPVTSATHTFTFTGADGYPAMTVSAWSGSLASTPYDTENGNDVGSAATCTTGSVTPSEDNCLLIFHCGVHSGNCDGVDVGTDLQTWTLAASYGGRVAYQIQTTATARNPSFSIIDTPNWTAANIAVFKAGALTNYIVPGIMTPLRRYSMRFSTPRGGPEAPPPATGSPWYYNANQVVAS